MSKRKQHSHETVLEAIRYVKEKKIAVHRASRVFGIPYSTLRDKIRGRRPVFPTRLFALKTDEEEQLVNWIQEAAKRGFKPTREEIKDEGKKILDSRNARSRFKNNRPGKNWCAGFCRRHPELVENISRTCSRKATTSAAKVIIKEDVSELEASLCEPTSEGLYEPAVTTASAVDPVPTVSIETVKCLLCTAFDFGKERTLEYMAGYERREENLSDENDFVTFSILMDNILSKSTGQVLCNCSINTPLPHTDYSKVKHRDLNNIKGDENSQRKAKEKKKIKKRKRKLKDMKKTIRKLERKLQKIYASLSESVSSIESDSEDEKMEPVLSHHDNL